MRTETELRSALQGFGLESPYSAAQILKTARKRRRNRRVAGASGVVAMSLAAFGLIPQLDGREPSLSAAAPTVVSSPAPTSTRLTIAERYTLGPEGKFGHERMAAITDSTVPEVLILSNRRSITLTRLDDETAQPGPVFLFADPYPDLEPVPGLQRITVDGVRVKMVFGVDTDEHPTANQAAWIHNGQVYGLYDGREYWEGKVYGLTPGEFVDLVKAVIRGEIPNQK
jgi:hypothetical protein